MTRSEIHQNFVLFVERMRVDQRLSIREMSQRLGMTESSYKNMIYRKTDTIDIEVACRLYDITHKFMWEMCGYDSADNDFISKYAVLPEYQRRVLHQVIIFLGREHEV